MTAAWKMMANQSVPIAGPPVAESVRGKVEVVINTRAGRQARRTKTIESIIRGDAEVWNPVPCIPCQKLRHHIQPVRHACTTGVP